MADFNIKEQADDMLELISTFSTLSTMEIACADDECHTDFDIAILSCCTILTKCMVEICELATFRQAYLDDEVDNE